MTDGQWKDCHNYLVTCDRIDGEWSDPIYLNSSGFDPSLFHDEDGKKYLLNMLWDPRVGNHNFYGIVMQEYDHEKKSWSESQKSSSREPTSNWWKGRTFTKSASITIC